MSPSCITVLLPVHVVIFSCPIFVRRTSPFQGLLDLSAGGHDIVAGEAGGADGAREGRPPRQDRGGRGRQHGTHAAQAGKTELDSTFWDQPPNFRPKSGLQIERYPEFRPQNRVCQVQFNSVSLRLYRCIPLQVFIWKSGPGFNTETGAKNPT